MPEGSRTRPDGVILVVSIDTEEDNWTRDRNGVTVKNIREIPRVAAFFERLRVRPTWFTAYQVASNPRAAALMREVGDSRGEIAAHLHPWNTPPLLEAFVPRNSMLKNLPGSLQHAKLRRVSAALEDAFEFTPAVFRAGRYGLGRNTVEALLSCGYRIDSSVTPFLSWQDVDDGPSFVGAPLGLYSLSPEHAVTEPTPGGRLLELPLSCGFSRTPFRRWSAVHRALDAPPLRPLRLVDVAHRTGLLKRIVLSPEMSTVREMLTLSRRLLHVGVRHLHVTCHSPTFTPGLTPFTATSRDVDGLYGAFEAYLDGLSRLTSMTFATVSEAAALLAPHGRANTPLEVATC